MITVLYWQEQTLFFEGFASKNKRMGRFNCNHSLQAKANLFLKNKRFYSKILFIFALTFTSESFYSDSLVPTNISLVLSFVWYDNFTDSLITYLSANFLPDPRKPEAHIRCFRQHARFQSQLCFNRYVWASGASTRQCDLEQPLLWHTFPHRIKITYIYVRDR